MTIQVLTFVHVDTIYFTISLISLINKIEKTVAKVVFYRIDLFIFALIKT